MMNRESDVPLAQAEEVTSKKINSNTEKPGVLDPSHELLYQA